MVPGIAIGEANHLYDVAGRTKQRRRAAGSVIRIVGVSSDDEQAQRIHAKPYVERLS